MVNFLGISIVGQTNEGGDGGIYVGSIMKGLVTLFCKCMRNYIMIKCIVLNTMHHRQQVFHC